PKIRGGVTYRHEGLKEFLQADRPNSPARHASISAALNDFSLYLARYVVEDLFKGKLIYAGGDDVLAMISIDDLLGAMLMLRLAYSGVFPDKDGADQLWKLLGTAPSEELVLR